MIDYLIISLYPFLGRAVYFIYICSTDDVMHYQYLIQKSSTFRLIILMLTYDIVFHKCESNSEALVMHIKRWTSSWGVRIQGISFAIDGIIQNDRLVNCITPRCLNGEYSRPNESNACICACVCVCTHVCARALVCVNFVEN